MVIIRYRFFNILGFRIFFFSVFRNIFVVVKLCKCFFFSLENMIIVLKKKFCILKYDLKIFLKLCFILWKLG